MYRIFPQWRRQVSARTRFRCTPVISSLLYGLELGGGFLVFIRGGAYYGLVAAVLLLGRPAAAALYLGIYGLVRSILLWIIGRSITEGAETTRVVERLMHLEPMVAVIGAFLMAVVSGIWLSAV